MTDEFKTALDNFVKLTQESIGAHFAQNYPNLTPPRIYVDPRGKKYLRVVREDHDGSSRAVHLFVEVATGLIWKAASWKAPALNSPRGSIFADDPLAGTTPFGAQYLR